jgi:hypothetical protein
MTNRQIHIGVQVLYIIAPGEARPAVITGVTQDENSGPLPNMAVMLDGENDHQFIEHQERSGTVVWRSAVRMGLAPGHWCFVDDVYEQYKFITELRIAPPAPALEPPPPPAPEPEHPELAWPAIDRDAGIESDVQETEPPSAPSEEGTEEQEDEVL